MTFLLRLSIVVIVFALCPLVAAGDGTASREIREWRDNTGTFSVQATLIEVDTDTASVTLRGQGGRTTVVPFRRLSKADQRYVSDIRGRLKPGAGSKKPQSERNAQFELVKFQGIDWFKQFDDAVKVAQGREDTMADDKPIMSFRVHGDLCGGI